MADLFSEVDEDVRAERVRAALKRWAPVAAGLAVVVVIAVGAWQEVLSHRDRRDARLAGLFFDAQTAADSVPDTTDAHVARARAIALFKTLEDAPAPGIRTLARLRASQLLGDSGDEAGAIRLLDAVAADAGAPDPLRELATLLSAERQLSGPNGAAQDARLAALERPGAPFRDLALEAGAMIALKNGHPDETRRVLSTLIADGDAPSSLRERASTVLQAIGAASAGARG